MLLVCFSGPAKLPGKALLAESSCPALMPPLSCSVCGSDPWAEAERAPGDSGWPTESRGPAESQYLALPILTLQ